MYLLVISTAISVQFGQCAYAIYRYGSGYNHGCDDAKLADQSEIYINQPEEVRTFILILLCKGMNHALTLALSTNPISCHPPTLQARHLPHL